MLESTMRNGQFSEDKHQTVKDEIEVVTRALPLKVDTQASNMSKASWYIREESYGQLKYTHEHRHSLLNLFLPCIKYARPFTTKARTKKEREKEKEKKIQNFQGAATNRVSG
jgi:hypothetical protein